MQKRPAQFCADLPGKTTSRFSGPPSPGSAVKNVCSVHRIIFARVLPTTVHCTRIFKNRKGETPAHLPAFPRICRAVAGSVNKSLFVDFSNGCARMFLALLVVLWFNPCF
jgi:hypothetical protein